MHHGAVGLDVVVGPVDLDEARVGLGAVDVVGPGVAVLHDAVLVDQPALGVEGVLRLGLEPVGLGYKVRPILNQYIRT